MAHRIVPSSGDVAIEAEAPTAEEALVEAARGFSEVVTAGSPLEARKRLAVRLMGPDRAAILVRFLNELVFRFATEEFLPVSGRLRLTPKEGGFELSGELSGDRFDERRHKGGTEVKAATYHGLRFEETAKGWRIHALLDL